MTDKQRRSWNPPPPPPTPSTAPLAAVGLEASWERTREDAERVDARDVATFKGTATVVLHNVRSGVDALLEERAWFERQPDAPKVDFGRVASATEAAEALVFLASRARRGATDRGLRGRIADARAKLTALRTAAEALRLANAVAEIPPLTGTGPTAVARDLVEHAAFFRGARARTRHLTAVTPELIREAAEFGTALLRDITPKGAPARRERPEAERAAAEQRDRVAVVVAERYHYVERAAGWRWGAAAAEHVPGMLARDTSRGAAASDDALDEESDEESDDAPADDATADDATTDDATDAPRDDAPDEGEPEAARDGDEDGAADAQTPAIKAKAAPAPAAKAKAPPPKKPTRAAPKTR